MLTKITIVNCNKVSTTKWMSDDRYIDRNYHRYDYDG